MSHTLRLYKKSDKIFAHYDGKEDQAVKIVLLRPLSGRSAEIALWGEKEEFATIDNIDTLDGPSRAIAREALEKYYFTPEIVRIIKTEAKFGTRYWEVRTDRGDKSFAMKNPFVNIRWTGEDELFIRDVLDNTYHIASLSKLDVNSRRQFEKIV
jgi:hypothetical protein